MLYKSVTCNSSKVLRRKLRNKLIHSQAQLEGQQTSSALAARLSNAPGKNAEGTCPCHGNRLLRLMPVCKVLPMQSFASGYFMAPTVIMLRTLLPAWPYTLDCVHARPRRVKRRSTNEVVVHEQDTTLNDSTKIIKGAQPIPPKVGNLLKHLPERLSTAEFLKVSSSDRYSHCRVLSMTWVKALASHMSHEFVQFVVEDSRTGHRQRLLSDRQETSDWIIVPDPRMSTSSKIPWQQMTPYKRRHALPLPLVSLTFDNADTRPTLQQIAQLFASVTESCPQYSAAREMCWWYCEVAIERAEETFPDTTVKEWKWAKWRYSFILCNNWIRRRSLEKDAEEFETSCAREMLY
jgi:hypothetical protein